MKIIFELTDKEKELLLTFKKHRELSTSDGFKGWHNSEEWRTFRNNDLTYHCNHRDEGAYIRYALTPLGQLALKQITTESDENNIRPR